MVLKVDSLPTERPDSYLKIRTVVSLDGPIATQAHKAFPLPPTQVATKSTILCSFITSLIPTCKFNKYLSGGRNNPANRSLCLG